MKVWFVYVWYLNRRQIWEEADALLSYIPIFIVVYCAKSKYVLFYSTNYKPRRISFVIDIFHRKTKPVSICRKASYECVNSVNFDFLIREIFMKKNSLEHNLKISLHLCS